MKNTECLDVKMVHLLISNICKENGYDYHKKEYFEYDGVTLSRDINGARNILLRCMRDSSTCGCNAMG